MNGTINAKLADIVTQFKASVDDGKLSELESTLLDTIKQQFLDYTQEDLEITYDSRYAVRGKKGRREHAGIMPLVSDPTTGMVYSICVKMPVKHDDNFDYYCRDKESVEWKVRYEIGNLHGWIEPTQNRQQTAANEAIEESRSMIGYYDDNNEFHKLTALDLWRALSTAGLHDMVPFSPYSRKEYGGIVYLGNMDATQRKDFKDSFHNQPINNLHCAEAHDLVFIDLGSLTIALQNSEEPPGDSVARIAIVDTTDGDMAALSDPVLVPKDALHRISSTSYALLRQPMQRRLQQFSSYLKTVIDSINPISHLPPISSEVAIFLDTLLTRKDSTSSDWIVRCSCCNVFCGLFADEVAKLSTEEFETIKNTPRECRECTNLKLLQSIDCSRCNEHFAFPHFLQLQYKTKGLQTPAECIDCRKLTATEDMDRKRQRK